MLCLPEEVGKGAAEAVAVDNPGTGAQQGARHRHGGSDAELDV